MLWNLAYFILAILLLIGIHEYGHFKVARWAGVRVLRFSFGFGPVLARWQDRHDTEFVLSLLPLGGYVKMLGESPDAIPSSMHPQAFFSQSIPKRLAIVLAGPLANFIFAFFAFWLAFTIGVRSYAPIIDGIQPDGLAAAAGLNGQQEILTVNQTPIQTWYDFQYALMPLLAHEKSVMIRFKRLFDHQQSTLTLPLNVVDNGQQDGFLAAWGLIPFLPKIPPVIARVIPGSPADQAKLQPGDRILRLQDQAIVDWEDVVRYVTEHPDQTVQINVLSQHELLTRTVHVSHHRLLDKTVGFLGVESLPRQWPSAWVRWSRVTPWRALPLAGERTLNLIFSTFTFIGRMITGQSSWQHVSGPVGIALVAGESAHGGVAQYLAFLALLSISLGTLNLLPIPLLDGGQALFLIIEWLRGKPLSERFKITGFQVGIVLLMILMTIALKNDLTRL